MILNWLSSPPESYTALTRICRSHTTFASGKRSPVMIGGRKLRRLPLVTTQLVMFGKFNKLTYFFT